MRRESVSPLRTLPLVAPLHVRHPGFVVPNGESVDGLQSTEHAKVRPVLFWLSPLLGLSRAQRGAAKWVTLSSVRSCAPRTSRGPLPIVCESRGSTMVTTLISDDMVAVLADRCQRHLSRSSVFVGQVASLQHPCSVWSPRLASVPRHLAIPKRRLCNGCVSNFERYLHRAGELLLGHDRTALLCTRWPKVVSLLIHLVHVDSLLCQERILPHRGH